MIEIEKFGSHNGHPVWRSILTRGDLAAEILSFGAITKSLSYKSSNLILGYEAFTGYLSDTFSMGILAGRVANRISYGRFTLNGRQYTLETNDGPHHLHGGSAGFGKKHWAIEKDTENNAVILKYQSQHLEAGYPGRLDVTAVISLSETGLTYQIDAVPSEETPVNIAQHNYYNLGGSTRDHLLQIRSDGVCLTDETLIPTGVVTLPDNALNFSTSRKLRDADPGFSGIDINYSLSPQSGSSAVLEGKKATVQIHTNQVGLQIYTGHNLSHPFAPFQGICMEPQYFPDAVNQPTFQSCMHTPDNPYSQTTVVSVSGPSGSVL